MTTTATVTAVPALTVAEAEQVLAGVHGASRKGLEDGTRVHIHYSAFGQPTAEAISHAERASDLGLPRDRYTGRISRVWRSKGNDLLVTLWVELERDHLYRTLNITKGSVHKIVVLGN
jgi:hypothetical protein